MAEKLTEPVEEARPLYEKLERITLKDTAKLMTSSFYQDRFVAEYVQLKIRYEKLKHILNLWDAWNEKEHPCEPIPGTVELYKERFTEWMGFLPSCSYSLLRDQQRTMGELLHILEVRAAIEDIPIGALYIKVW